MARREPYSEKEVERMIAMRKEGMFFKDIAQALGRSESSVTRAHTRATGETRDRCVIGLVGRRSQWTPERDEELRALRWEGLSFSRIGDRLATSEGSVIRRANELNVVINPDLLIVRNKPMQAGPSQRQMMKRSEAQRTPEERLAAQARYLKNDAADAGAFWHLISNEPWPGVHAHG